MVQVRGIPRRPPLRWPLVVLLALLLLSAVLPTAVFAKKSAKSPAALDKSLPASSAPTTSLAEQLPTSTFSRNKKSRDPISSTLEPSEDPKTDVKTISKASKEPTKTSTAVLTSLPSKDVSTTTSDTSPTSTVQPDTSASTSEAPVRTKSKKSRSILSTTTSEQSSVATSTTESVRPQSSVAEPSSITSEVISASTITEKETVRATEKSTVVESLSTSLPSTEPQPTKATEGVPSDVTPTSLASSTETPSASSSSPSDVTPTSLASSAETPSASSSSPTDVTREPTTSTSVVETISTLPSVSEPVKSTQGISDVPGTTTAAPEATESSSVTPATRPSTVVNRRKKRPVTRRPETLSTFAEPEETSGLTVATDATEITSVIPAPTETPEQPSQSNERQTPTETTPSPPLESPQRSQEEPTLTPTPDPTLPPNPPLPSITDQPPAPSPVPPAQTPVPVPPSEPPTSDAPAPGPAPKPTKVPPQIPSEDPPKPSADSPKPTQAQQIVLPTPSSRPSPIKALNIETAPIILTPAKDNTAPSAAVIVGAAGPFPASVPTTPLPGQNDAASGAPNGASGPTPPLGAQPATNSLDQEAGKPSTAVIAGASVAGIMVVVVAGLAVGYRMRPKPSGPALESGFASPHGFDGKPPSSAGGSIPRGAGPGVFAGSNHSQEHIATIPSNFDVEWSLNALSTGSTFNPKYPSPQRNVQGEFADEAFLGVPTLAPYRPTPGVHNTAAAASIGMPALAVAPISPVWSSGASEAPATSEPVSLARSRQSAVTVVDTENANEFFTGHHHAMPEYDPAFLNAGAPASAVGAGSGMLLSKSLDSDRHFDSGSEMSTIDRPQIITTPYALASRNPYTYENDRYPRDSQSTNGDWTNSTYSNDNDSGYDPDTADTQVGTPVTSSERPHSRVPYAFSGAQRTNVVDMLGDSSSEEFDIDDQGLAPSSMDMAEEVKNAYKKVFRLTYQSAGSFESDGAPVLAPLDGMV